MEQRLLSQHPDRQFSGTADSRSLPSVIPLQFQLSCNQAQKGGFSGSVPSYDRNFLGSLYLKINMGKHGFSAQRNRSVCDLVFHMYSPH